MLPPRTKRASGIFQTDNLAHTAPDRSDQIAITVIVQIGRDHFECVRQTNYLMPLPTYR